jgi:hypothetical protein
MRERLVRCQHTVTLLLLLMCVVLLLLLLLLQVPCQA